MIQRRSSDCSQYTPCLEAAHQLVLVDGDGGAHEGHHHRAAGRRLALHFIKSLNVPLTQVGGCTFKRIDACVERAWFTRLRL